ELAPAIADGALLAAASASESRSISVRANRVARAVEIVSVDLIAIDVIPVDVVPVDSIAVDCVAVDVVPVDVDIVLTYNRISIQGGAVSANVAVNDRAIDANVPVAVIDVNVAIDIDERSIDTDPTTAGPAVVIDAPAIPIPVVVQPCADRQSSTESDCRRSDDFARRWPALYVNHFGVVFRDVNDLRLRRHNFDYLARDNH